MCIFFVLLRTYSLWESLGRKTWTRLKKLCGSDFRSLGESDDYMPTLILRIVLVLKIESLLYVYFFLSFYVRTHYGRVWDERLGQG